MKFKLVEDLDRGLETQSSVTTLNEGNHEGKMRILNYIIISLDSNATIQKLNTVHFHHILGGKENISLKNSGKLVVLEPRLHKILHNYCNSLVSLNEICGGSERQKDVILNHCFNTYIKDICSTVPLKDGKYSILVQNSILNDIKSGGLTKDEN